MANKIIYTKDLNPWRNLALEEYLLDNVKESQCILYLWQNQNTVVIGKNQNPWKECRIELLEGEGGKLARRSSGGGAVFHDTGNLNFSFLVDRQAFDLEKQLKVILTAVRQMGIQAVFSGRNDLTVDDRKFSGNAFRYRKHSALHHGTLLISANMDKLTRYLQVPEDKIRSKGIDSVRSRVVNLSEFNKELTIDQMVQALIESFKAIYGNVAEVSEGEAGIDQTVLDKLYQTYSSWEWRFGESPKFDIEIKNRFSWGSLELGLQLEDGKIQKAMAYSDAMNEAFIERIPKALEQCMFHSASMSKAISTIDNYGDNNGQAMSKDIEEWLIKKGF